MAENILTVSLKEYKTEIDDLRASLLGLDETSEQWKSTEAEIIDMQTKLNEVMRIGKEATVAQEGSYNYLSQTMSELKKQWKATTDEVERKNLGTQISGINNQLKEMDASIGVYGRNVGDYANQFKSAFSQMGAVSQVMGSEVSGAVGQATAKLNVLSQALNVLKAHPVIAVIAVVVGLLVKCYQAFANTAEGANKLSQAFSSVNGVGVVFEKLMQAIGSVISSVVIPVFNALMAVIETLVQGLGYVVQGIAWITGDEGLSQAAESMKNIRQETEKSVEAERERQRIQKATNALRVKEAKQQITIDELRAKAVDKENYSLKQRKKFAEEAHKMEQAILDEKIKIAQANLTLIKQENARNGSTKEALEKERQLEIELYNLIAQKNKNDRAYNQERNRMNKEARKEASSASRAQNKADEERKKAQEKYLDYLKQEDEISQQLVSEANEYNKLLKDRTENDRYNKEVAEINNQKGATQAQKDKELEVAEERHQMNLNNIQKKYFEESDKRKLEHNEYTYTTQEKYNAKYKGNVSDFYNDMINATDEYYVSLENITELDFVSRREILQKQLEDGKLTQEAFSKAVKEEYDLKKEKKEQLERELTDKILELNQKRSEAEILQMSVNSEKLYNARLKDIDKYGYQYLQMQGKNDEQALVLRKQTLAEEKQAEEDYYRTQWYIANKRLEDIKAFGKSETETVDEYNQRILDANAQEMESYNRWKASIANLEITQGSNDNFDLLQNFKISESVDAMRQAKLELDHIYQEEGESFESYLARKLQAQDKYNKAVNNRIKAEENSWKSLGTGLGGIMDTLVDMDNDRIKTQEENGEITEEQAEKQFEANKKYQYASAVISMLAGATGIFMSTMKDDTIQPTWLRPALAATQYAAVIATGIAQIKKIKDSTLSGTSSGSSSGSTSSGVMSASVTPLLDEQLDQNSYTQLNTENASESKDTKVIVLEQDITDAQNKVKTRVDESSF